MIAPFWCARAQLLLSSYLKLRYINCPAPSLRHEFCSGVVRGWQFSIQQTGIYTKVDTLHMHHQQHLPGVPATVEEVENCWHDEEDEVED